MLRSLLLVAVVPAALLAQRPDSSARRAEIERRAAVVLPKVVGWRRDSHEHLELSCEEIRTAKLVADHLRALGLEVRDRLGGNGGVREHLIPDRAVLIGTIRTFDAAMRREIHARLKQTAEGIAASAGLTADVKVIVGYPVTVSDRALVERMRSALARAAGAGKVQDIPLTKAGPNHSTTFNPSEESLPIGVCAYALLAADFLTGAKPRATP